MEVPEALVEWAAAALEAEKQRNREYRNRRRLEILKSTVETSRHFCEAPPSEAFVAAQEPGVDAYLPFDERKGEEGEGERESDAPHAHVDEFDQLFEACWVAEETEYGQTFEEHKRAREKPMDQRIDIQKPAVVARGSPPSNYTCFCCQRRPAYDLQTPDDVFATALRMSDEHTAIKCVIKMAQMLKEEDYNGVLERTACCRTVRCMLAQNRLSCENYESWVFSGDQGTPGTSQRSQLEKGTDRKDQGLRFADSIIFLRCLAVQRPLIVSEAELYALWKWVIMNSQFIQEREKNFIATAMAIVESPKVFGYTFADPQSFVNRMSSFPRRYFQRVMFRHILRMDLSQSRWRSGANRILETAMPKPADVAYGLTCEDNWKAQGCPVDTQGRRTHRVNKDAPHAALFTIDGFKKAITEAVGANSEYVLPYIHGNSTNTASIGTETHREVQVLMKMMSGSHKRPCAIAHGKPAAPTCASVQKNSGVHPRERYRSIPIAEDCDDQECDAWVHLFVDHLDNGNPFGFEKEDPVKNPGGGSKACSVLRAVELYEPKKVAPVTERRRFFERCTQAIPLKRSKSNIACS